MKMYGPGDNEIAEIGLEEILEGIIPGSEPLDDGKQRSQENDNSPSGIDDPFSF